jgi:hypothetical protein
MKVKGRRRMGVGDLMPTVRPHLHPEKAAGAKFFVVAALGWKDRVAAHTIRYCTIV